jgi:hypothetical protein
VIEEKHLRAIIEYETRFKRKNPTPEVVEKPPVPVKLVEEEPEMIVETKGKKDGDGSEMSSVQQKLWNMINNRIMLEPPEPLSDVNMENLKDYLLRSPLLIPIDIESLLKRALDGDELFPVLHSETPAGINTIKMSLHDEVRWFYDAMDSRERPRLGLISLSRNYMTVNFTNFTGNAYIQLNPDILRTRCNLVSPKRNLATFNNAEYVVDEFPIVSRQYLSRPNEETKDDTPTDRKNSILGDHLPVIIHGPIRLDRDVVGFALPENLEGDKFLNLYSKIQKLVDRTGKRFKVHEIGSK